jgi:hypothetical protein
MTRLTTIVVASALVGAGVARADVSASATVDTGQTAQSQAPNSLVVPKGSLQLDAFVELDLSSGEAFHAVSVSPDLWYGVTDDLTLGLVHSTTGATGFIGGIEDSICVGQACEHVYPDVGLDARYQLARPLALDVGVYAVDTDPFQLAVKLGIAGRWAWGKLSLETQLSLFIGLTNRNPTVAVPAPPVPPAPNTEDLFLPITVAYLVAPRVDLALQPGLVLPFTQTGDTWAIPLAIAVRFAATPRFGIGLAFSFLDLIGGGKGTGVDARSLTLGGTYAF